MMSCPHGEWHEQCCSMCYFSTQLSYWQTRAELHQFRDAEWAQVQAQAAIVLALVDLADAIRGVKDAE